MCIKHNSRNIVRSHIKFYKYLLSAWPIQSTVTGTGDIITTKCQLFISFYYYYYYYYYFLPHYANQQDSFLLKNYSISTSNVILQHFKRALPDSLFHVCASDYSRRGQVFKQRKINYSRQITEQKAENLDLDPISATITCVLLGKSCKVFESQAPHLWIGRVW